MAVFDTAQRDLYVACSGDSRAVAGIWEESADGTGSWRVEVLSEDQTGRNPNELKRYGILHPGFSDPPNLCIECSQNTLKTRPTTSSALGEFLGV
jgi:serine/threonine protein phosphatase PrpC